MPSQKAERLNLLGMIGCHNRYDSFSTTRSIIADKVADFQEDLSFGMNKNTFVVLDNAKIHRSKKIIELRLLGKERTILSSLLLATIRTLLKCCGGYSKEKGSSQRIVYLRIPCFTL